ncbi:Regulating synaptic membrane exocytosis protein 1 [Portunus trituberculatus]|uniref:Regulating synaptic membrane exocytosis protein 1 n=1 Tax=Portunus trituberculatus TaxID=210409 RepID=A0A5B7DV20_PORTR|nr:Regulating synaptic membrane exocytosis protein 1 [Portunus trituberculatus]
MPCVPNSPGEEEAQGENKEAGESQDPGAAEEVEGKPEGGAIAKQGCEEGEVVEEEEAEEALEDEKGEEEVEEVEEEEEVECPEGEYSAEGSTSPQEAVAGGSTTGPTLERMEGSLSDSATGMLTVDGKERRRVTNGKQGPSGGLSKKSSSTSKLSDTEGGRKRSTSGVQRSQEVVPTPTQARLVKQPSKESTDGSMNSISSEGSSRVPSMRLGTDGQLSEFIEGLGQGQLVGRQVLATPALGDIQLSMCERKNKLEVEVIRARGLQSPYVKVYLVAGKKCVAKAKTSTARRTLDPLYQQQLIFHERYQGCVLQVCAACGSRAL